MVPFANLASPPTSSSRRVSQPPLLAEIRSTKSAPAKPSKSPVVQQLNESKTDKFDKKIFLYDCLTDTCDESSHVTDLCDNVKPDADGSIHSYSHVEEFAQSYNLNESTKYALIHSSDAVQIAVMQQSLDNARNPSAVVMSRIRKFEHAPSEAIASPGTRNSPTAETQNSPKPKRKGRSRT